MRGGGDQNNICSPLSKFVFEDIRGRPPPPLADSSVIYLSFFCFLKGGRKPYDGSDRSYFWDTVPRKAK